MTINAISVLASMVLLLPPMTLCFLTFKWRWLAANVLMGLAFGAAALTCVAIMAFGVTEPSLGWLHYNALVSVVLLLISFIAWIVLRYAATNFEQDSHGKRFLIWFTCTVIAVMSVIASDNLILFWCAWAAISLSFHQLLMFYPTRPRAVLAAHKKFILARVAETLLGVAFFLLWQEHGSLNITQILNQYPVQGLNTNEHIAIVLISLVALIKCAQLPVHGWLIQVVESPTPVSALLHAGVINLGGFLLILFAPIFSQSFIAQVVVLVVAGLSLVVAALVMMTRISIKVRLAWSTNAQMGLMLVECALGLYELALLHMLAHSCYKAFAFLNSGTAVTDYLSGQHRDKTQPSIGAWAISILLLVPCIALLIVTTGSALFPLSPWLVVAAALTFLLAQRIALGAPTQTVQAFLWCLVLLLTYMALKTILSPVIPMNAHTYSGLEDIWVISLLAVLVLGYFLLQYRPQNTSSHNLFIALNAGFYLDEWLTRITLKLWPISLPRIADTESNTTHGAL